MSHAQKIRESAQEQNLQKLHNSLYEFVGAVEYCAEFGISSKTTLHAATIPIKNKKATPIGEALLAIQDAFPELKSVKLTLPGKKKTQYGTSYNPDDRISLKAAQGSSREAVIKWVGAMKILLEDPQSMEQLNDLVTEIDQRASLNNFAKTPDGKKLLSGFQDNKHHPAATQIKALEKLDEKEAKRITNASAIRESFNNAVDKNKLPYPNLTTILASHAEYALTLPSPNTHSIEMTCDGKRECDRLAQGFTELAAQMAKTSGYKQIGNDLSFDSIGTYQEPILRISTSKASITPALEKLIDASQHENISTAVNESEVAEKITTPLTKHYLEAMLNTRPISLESVQR